MSIPSVLTPAVSKRVSFARVLNSFPRYCINSIPSKKRTDRRENRLSSSSTIKATTQYSNPVTMASNTAAWITADHAYPFEIKPSPLGIPRENQILIQNHALAINPIDTYFQHLPSFHLPLTYPAILGEDIAGTVTAIGSGVTRFKVGDRVIANTVGFLTKRSEDLGFQAYTTVPTNMASEIPDDMSFETAVVVPLGLSTAAAGMFQDEYLKLQYPTEPKQKPTGKTLLIWGGATSVGSNAIQLAVAAGYEVITTASPKNFDYVKKLGASLVFDYKSPTVGQDLLDSFKSKTIAGALDCVGGSAATSCVDLVQKSVGSKFVATVKPPPAVPEGVAIKHVFATTIMTNGVGKAIYEDFLPKALKMKTFLPAPEPLVAGHGLESVQGAVDLLHKGVSAKKIVVLL